MDTTSISFRWNLAYADAYTDLLWEKNTVRLLKNTTEVVQANRGIMILIVGFQLTRHGKKEICVTNCAAIK